MSWSFIKCSNHLKKDSLWIFLRPYDNFYLDISQVYCREKSMINSDPSLTSFHRDVKLMNLKIVKSVEIQNSLILTISKTVRNWLTFGGNMKFVDWKFLLKKFIVVNVVWSSRIFRWRSLDKEIWQIEKMSLPNLPIPRLKWTWMRKFHISTKS